MALIDDLLLAGDNMIEKIDKALSTHDYTGLGTQLRSVVSDTTSTVIKSGVGAVSDVIKATRKAVSYRPPFFTKEVSHDLGKGQIWAGAAMIAFAFVLLAGVSVPFFIGGMKIPAVAGMIFLAVVMAVGIGVVMSGASMKKLVSRFYEYGKIVGDRSYILIRELADKTDRGEDEVMSDLKKMKMKGFLPTATFDRDHSTLMLTDEVYMEYARSVRAASEREAAQKTVEVPKTSSNQMSFYKIDESLPEDVKAILKDGNDYLNRIRSYNDMIPDSESMSDKLYTLEATVLSIFKKVQKQPETASDLRKFMNYYLPTTEKLLTSYVKLGKEDDSIENVKNARAEIEDAMDVINEAFVKLLNQLFLDDAWDISSDISVMKTMMKQDALL